MYVCINIYIQAKNKAAHQALHANLDSLQLLAASSLLRLPGMSAAVVGLVEVSARNLRNKINIILYYIYIIIIIIQTNYM
jgi:hypothetical protein